MLSKAWRFIFEYNELERIRIKYFLKIQKLVASTVGVNLVRKGEGSRKVVPGIATLPGISSQVILAGASSYAIGNIFQNHFQNDENLFDFNVDGMISKFEIFLVKLNG